MKKTLYGQYCPIAISLEILGGRWTLLIIRELIGGSTRFNDIHRGVPLMSRSLLSERLKSLESAKLIDRTHSARSGHAEYTLSEAGQSLLPVIASVGKWGQEWVNKSVVMDEIDGGYLMWSIRSSASWTADMGARMVARFEFSDRDEKKRFHWLIIEETEIDICYVDPGLEVNTWIETDLRSMVEVWMGWRPLKDALSAGDIGIYGAPNLTQDPLRWIGQSPVAGISQRPSEEQILVLIEKVRA
jgi:DNA-binding HxlR family transcriptional regulator